MYIFLYERSNDHRANRQTNHKSRPIVIFRLQISQNLSKRHFILQQYTILKIKMYNLF